MSGRESLDWSWRVSWTIIWEEAGTVWSSQKTSDEILNCCKRCRFLEIRAMPMNNVSKMLACELDSIPTDTCTSHSIEMRHVRFLYRQGRLSHTSRLHQQQQSCAGRQQMWGKCEDSIGVYIHKNRVLWIYNIHCVYDYWTHLHHHLSVSVI